MKRSIVVRKAGPLLVVRQNGDDPDEQDWSEFLLVLSAQRREFRADAQKILVCTDGGSPNADQRARLAHILDNFHPRVALVSGSVKVRFVGALIAMFQRNYRQFSPSELKLAFAHLKLAPAECEFAEKALRELEALLRTPSPL